MRDCFDVVREEPESLYADTDINRKGRRGKTENIFIIEYCGPARQRKAVLPKPKEIESDEDIDL